MKIYGKITPLLVAITVLVLLAISIYDCNEAGSQITLEPTASPVVAAQDSTPILPDSPDIDWGDRSVFRPGLVGSEQYVLDQLPGSSVYHIDLRIKDDLLHLKGQEQVRYTNTEDVPLEELYFRLYPNIAGGEAHLSSVMVDGIVVEPKYEFENSAVRMPLPEPLAPDGQVVVQMDFEVVLAQEMAGNYGLFGYFDGFLVLDEFYPVIPVYDEKGWDVEVPPANGDVSNFDSGFYLTRVIAPASLTIVASGVEVDREYQGDNQIVTFAAGPARDFYIAAHEAYIAVSEQVGETTINSYALPNRLEGAEFALQVAKEALVDFTRRFGDYPYTEFDVLSTPMQALGIEYPGIVCISLALYNPNEEVLGLPSQVILESTVAHEVGHQWFYNIVGSNQIEEPWLDEAVTQYVTGLYYLDAYGQPTEQSYQESWSARWDRVDRAEIPIGIPAADYADGEYGAIVYGRGPMFIEELENKMGTETFDEFLQDYYTIHKWGIADGDAFRQLAEKHCQCDLSNLFEEWVY